MKEWLEKNKKWLGLALCIVAVTVLVVVIALQAGKTELGEDSTYEETTIETEPEVQSTVAEVEETESSERAEETTRETELQMLPEMAELYEQNPDIIGWITIEGTKIDYPLMFTPEEEEKYLYRNFEGKKDVQGVPFLDKDCSIDPESNNLIFYGHNMLAGTMFQNLLKYEDEEFWKEHPVIQMKTLYEERTYEIIGAFRDRVYYKNEDVFKFYQFIDIESEADFEEAMDYYKSKTPYDMGVSAEYGDSLITLVTCAYHHEYGRYVVVAKRIQ